jgi:catecholate siderophore receptor
VNVQMTGGPISLGRVDEVVSGRAGVVFKPAAGGSVYAAYGTSFNPSTESLTLANTATAANSVATAPEKSVSYEVGTKWDLLQNQLTLAAAGFITDKLNARTEDPANAADFVVLEGRQRVQGFELSAAGSLSERWKVFGGYTYLDGRVMSSKSALERGAPLSNTPRHSGNLWATCAPLTGLELGGGAQYVGERASAASNTARRAAPSYLLFDAMVSYKVNKALTLRFNAYNLADQRYISSLSGGHFIPGAGRSVQATTSLSF